MIRKMVYKDILASYFICLLSFPFLTFGLANNCTFGGKDLSKLDRFVTHIGYICLFCGWGE